MIATRFNPLGVSPPKKGAMQYIQDGLIAMWDGIENAGFGVHDANATVWKDLVGITDLTIGSGIVQDNALYCPAAEHCAYADANKAIQNALTFDGCVNVDSSGTGSAQCALYTGIRERGLFFSKLTYHFFVNGSANINTVMDKLRNNYYQIPENQPISATAVYDDEYRFYANGEEVPLFGVAQTMSGAGSDRGSRVEIGSAQKNNASHKFKGAVYCLRVYNRILTDAEIAHNYAIDKERF